MKNKFRIIATVAIIAGLASASPAALARGDIGFSITIGNVGNVGFPAQITVASPVYAYQPPPVYYPTRIVYTSPRVIYQPAPKWHYRHERHDGRRYKRGRR